MPNPPQRWTGPVALAAAVFGTMTIASGGLVLFGPEAARRAAGTAVPFVLIFNFAAGFAYLVGAVALWLNHPSARWIALAIGLATLVVLGIFTISAMIGTPVELRTAVALPFRAAVWLAIAYFAGRATRAA